MYRSGASSSRRRDLFTQRLLLATLRSQSLAVTTANTGLAVPQTGNTSRVEFHFLVTLGRGPVNSIIQHGSIALFRLPIHINCVKTAYYSSARYHELYMGYHSSLSLTN